MNLAQAFQPSVQQWLLIGIIGAVLLVLIMRGLRQRPKDGSPKQYRREIDSANKKTQQIHRDLEELLAELEKASGKITTRIEGEFARLNELMAESDRRISALRILLEASRQLSQRDNGKPAAVNQTANIDPRHERIYTLADSGLNCAQIARRLGENPGEIELILNLRTTQRK